MIDYDEALRLLEETVSGREDFVYEAPGPNGSCVYFDETGAPSCGVGFVLDGLGVKAATVWDEGVNSMGIGAAGNTLRLGLTASATTFLRDFQRSQDRGETWGNSLLLAKARHATDSIVLETF